MIAAHFDPSTSACMECGCTDDDACVNENGFRCNWVAPFLCSACRDEGIRLYAIATGRAAA